MKMSFLIIFLTIFVSTFSLTSQMTLDCAFTNGPFFSVVGYVYQCKVQETTKVVSDFKIVDDVNGMHEDSSTNAACQMLWVWGSIFHFIPRGIGEHFTGLEAIWIHYGGLKKLENLEQFPNLRYIYARHNQIEELKSEVFKGNPGIEWVDLKYNKLKFIDGEIFLPFFNLTNLNLKKNYCIDKHYNGKLKPPNTTLSLADIRIEIDVNCHLFNEIFCAMNNFSHQGENFMTCSAKGTTITASNITLTRLLYNRDELPEALLIRHQNFKYFPLNLSTLMPNLKAIQIIGCGLREISRENLENFVELKSLWLPRNEIEVLTSNIFDQNLKLERVSFYGNRLRVIDSKILEPLNNLNFANFEKNSCVDLEAKEGNFEELLSEIGNKCERNNLTIEMRKL